LPLKKTSKKIGFPLKDLKGAGMTVQFSRALLAAIVVAAASSATYAQDKWVVGQSAPLTGGNAKFGIDIRDGAKAYFDSINAAGGVQGRQIELVTLDDKNDRKAAGANTKTLLENKNLVALFGYASATLSLDALPQAEKSEVAFFAPFSGANPVRVKSPVLFTVRASYGEEMEKILNFWTSLGLKSVTVVHYDDEVGKQNLAVVTDYLKKINLVPKAFPLKRNATIAKSDIDALLAQQPEVLLSTVLSGAAAEIQKRLTGMGRMMPMSSISFIGADQFVKAAGEAGAGVSITQVVPNPNAQIPVVRECARALEAAGVKGGMNTTHLEACFGAKILVEGIRRAGKSVNAKSVLDSLSSLGSYDLGGFKVNFSPASRHGSQFVDMARVTKDGRLLTR
jgi:branched-chain amino acid transport system substrate-binding protein